eukprot:Gb_01667 [translate_table: standard]
MALSSALQASCKPSLQGSRSQKELFVSVLSKQVKCSPLISTRCQASTAVSNEPAFKSAGIPGEATPGHGGLKGNTVERNVVRVGLPSKGRMADDTLTLLKDCQLAVRQVNPRQYVAHIPGIKTVDILLSNSNYFAEQPFTYLVSYCHWGKCLRTQKENMYLSFLKHTPICCVSLLIIKSKRKACSKTGYSSVEVG